MAIPVYLFLTEDGGSKITGSMDVRYREGSIEVTGFTHNLRLLIDPAEFAKFQNNNNYGDDPVDQLWIRAGIDYARRSGF